MYNAMQPSAQESATVDNKTATAGLTVFSYSSDNALRTAVVPLDELAVKKSQYLGRCEVTIGATLSSEAP